MDGCKSTCNTSRGWRLPQSRNRGRDRGNRHFFPTVTEIGKKKKENSRKNTYFPKPNWYVFGIVGKLFQNGKEWCLFRADTLDISWVIQVSVSPSPCPTTKLHFYTCRVHMFFLTHNESYSFIQVLGFTMAAPMHRGCIIMIKEHIIIKWSDPRIFRDRGITPAITEIVFFFPRSRK